FSHLLRMQKRFGCLLTQPGNDWNAAEAENEEGVMRITHDARQFGLEYAIQYGNDLVGIGVRHGNAIQNKNGSCAPIVRSRTGSSEDRLPRCVKSRLTRTG